MITEIVLASAALYSAELLFLYIGLIKSQRAATEEKYEPSVSVIVAARNEEKFIGDCIESLLRLDYPEEKLELIVVNDSSSDRTGDIIRSYLSEKRAIKSITTSQRTGGLRGKTNAITAGIDSSSGEILMFTDADCRVKPGWVRETVKYFDPKTGIVGGFTTLTANNSFEGMQKLDWFFLFGISSAAAGWKMPLTVIGNNLSIRRAAYDETGGFREIPFSVTEDYAVVQAVLRRTDYRVKFPLNPLTLVESSPCKSWNHLYRQKQRWGVGGLDMVISGIIIMAVGWAAKAGLVLGSLTMNAEAWLAALSLTAAAEILFLSKPLRSFAEQGGFKYFPPFFLYFTLYVIALPFVAFFSRKVLWKERRF